MAEVGSAFVSVMPSAKGFGSKLNSQVSGDLKSSGSKAGKVFGGALKLGALGVLAGAAALGSFLKGSIEEAREAQKVGALTESTIKATGKAANVTAKQVGDLAGAISLKTGIDDETIQSGQNMLLTFKNIRNEAGKGNDIFDQTTETLVDLSAAMGTEPKQAAIQLGKALNDPIKGVSALSRVGVTFTEGQKKVIEGLVKGGETAEAQKVILEELNSEFGGAAEAQATAGDKMAVAWGNLQETAGNAILPLVDSLLPKLTSAINWLATNGVPAIRDFWDSLAPAREVISNVAGGIKDVTDLISKGDWKGAWDTARNTARNALSAVGSGVKDFARNRLLPNIKAAVGNARVAWAQKWKSFWKDPEKSYDKTMFVTRQFGHNLVEEHKQISIDATFTFLRQFRKLPGQTARTGVQTLNAWRESTSAMPGLSRHVAVDMGVNFLNALRSLPKGTSNIMAQVASGLISGSRGALSAARSIGVDIVMGMVGGIHDAAGALATAAADAVLGALASARNALDSHSPSRKFQALGHDAVDGLILGIDGGHGRVSSSMDRLAAGMVLNRPSLAGATGAAGGGGRAVFHLYDRDDVLLGSMEGVADGRIHGHAQLAGETARAM